MHTEHDREHHEIDAAAEEHGPGCRCIDCDPDSRIDALRDCEAFDHDARF